MRAFHAWAAILLLVAMGAGPAVADETYVRTYGGEPVRITVEADQTAIYFADQLRLRYQLEAPAETIVTFPTFGKTLGPFRVMERQSVGPIATADHAWLWRGEFVLEAEEAGALSVPGFGFSFADPAQQQADTVRMALDIQTDPIPVQVTSVVPEDAELTALRGIADPLDAEPPPPEAEKATYGWVWWVAAVLIALAVVEIGLLWARRRLWPRSDDAARPIHEIARDALVRLRARDFLDRDQFDAFYVALSGILRWYLQYRFGVQAPYRTTEEVAARTQSDGTMANHAAWLDTTLRHSDAVKFARERPTRAEATEVLNAIHAFVERTADSTVRVPAHAAPSVP